MSQEKNMDVMTAPASDKPANRVTSKTPSNRDESAIPHVDEPSFHVNSLPFIVLLCIVFFLPLFFLPGKDMSIEGTKGVFFGIAFSVLSVFWLFGRLKDGRFILPRSFVLYTIPILVLSLAVSTFLSHTPAVSFLGRGIDTDTSLFVLLLLALILLSTFVFQTKGRTVSLLLIFGSTALLVMIFHVVRLFLGDTALAFGIFESPSSSIIGGWFRLGFFAGFTVLLSAGLYRIFHMSKLATIVSLALYIVSLFFLVLVNYTLVWVLVGILALLMLARSLTSDKELSKKSLTILLGILVAFSLIFAGLNFIQKDTGNAITRNVSSWFGITSPQEIRVSLRGTYVVTSQMYREDMTKAIFGSGQGNFFQKWSLYKPQGVNTTPWWNVDFSRGVGFIPTTAVTLGLTGIVLWSAFFLLIIWTGVRYAFFVSATKDKPIVFAMFIITTYLWITMLLYTPGTVLTVFAFLSAGALIGTLVSEGGLRVREYSFLRKEGAGFFSVFVLIVLIIASISSGYFVTQKIRAVFLYREGVSVLSTEQDPKKAEELFLRALQIHKEDTYYRALGETGIIFMSQYLSQPGLTPEQAEKDLAPVLGLTLRYAREATTFDEKNYTNWMSLGNVYASLASFGVEDASREALIAYDRARTLAPLNPIVDYNVARLALTDGDKAKARVHVESALQKKGDYTDALALYSQILIDAGESGQALQALEQASVSARTDFTLWFQTGYLKYTSGDFKGAEISLRNALILNPQFANAKYFLGLSLYENKKTPEALTQFTEILSLNPENSEVKSIIENLRAGRGPFDALIEEPVETEAVEEDFDF